MGACVADCFRGSVSYSSLPVSSGGCPNVHVIVASCTWPVHSGRQSASDATVFMNLCTSTSGNIACGTYWCHNNYNCTVAMPCYLGT